MNIEEILKFIDNNFKTGNKKASIENLKLLTNYLNEKEITSIDVSNADKLVLNSPKLSKMIDNLLKLKDNDLLDNEAIFSLVLSYANINNIELNLEEKEELEESDTFTKTNYTTTKRGKRDSTDEYLSSLPHDILTREEEVKLAMEIENGSESAKEKLLYYNLRLVVSIAKKFLNKTNISFDDLIQEGNIGLMKAVDRFNYRRGCKFSTYATWWIRQSIIRYVYEQSKTIRIPTHYSEEIFKMKRIQKAMEIDLGRMPSDEELANELGVSVQKIKELKLVAQDIVSLSTPVGDEEDTTLEEFIESDENLDDMFLGEIFGSEVNKAIFEKSHLKEREKEVLKLRFGFGENNSPMTLEAVAREFGVTRERIRQIEAKAIRKLRVDPNIKNFSVNSIERENNYNENTYTNKQDNNIYNYKFLTYAVPREKKDNFDAEDWFYKSLRRK